MAQSLVDMAAGGIGSAREQLLGGQTARVEVNGVTFEVEGAPSQEAAEAAVRAEVERRPSILALKAQEQGLRFDPESRQATERSAAEKFLIGFGKEVQGTVDSVKEIVAGIQGDVSGATEIAAKREREQEAFDLLDEQGIGAEDAGQLVEVVSEFLIPAAAFVKGVRAGKTAKEAVESAADTKGGWGLGLLRIAAALRWSLNPGTRKLGRNAQTLKEWVQEGKRLGLKSDKVEKAMQTPQGRKAIEEAAKAEPSPAVARATARKLDQAAKRVDKEKGPSGATERRLEAIRDRQRDVRARSAREARQGQEQAARSTQRKAEEIRQNPQGTFRDVSAERLAARKENRALLRDLIKKAETGGR